MSVEIARRTIGPGHPPFVVAEVGINHNGELGKALEMIAVARDAGADAVKFQTFRAAEFCGDPAQQFTYKSAGKEVTESMLAMFKRYEFQRADWFTIKKACDEIGIVFLSTPQNRSDLDILMEVGVPAIKVGSDDFTNLPLLKSYAETRLPLILSSGMSNLSEAHQALEEVGAFDGYPTVLLHCTSQYPTPPADANLRKITTLSNAFPGVVIGFSDHTEGALASTAAVALGASFFEKHFTLDHDLPGPDHWFSEDPAGLKRWVQAIRQSHSMLGSAIVRPTAAEESNRREFRRSVVALRAIHKGERLNTENLGVRRPGTGLSPSLLKEILGCTASRELRRGEVLRLSDFQG